MVCRGVWVVGAIRVVVLFVPHASVFHEGSTREPRSETQLDGFCTQRVDRISTSRLRVRMKQDGQCVVCNESAMGKVEAMIPLGGKPRLYCAEALHQKRQPPNALTSRPLMSRRNDLHLPTILSVAPLHLLGKLATLALATHEETCALRVLRKPLKR